MPMVWALISCHIVRRLILVCTVCICPIYGILCSNRLNGLMLLKYDISAKSAGPDQTPRLCGVSSGFALLVLRPIYETLCFNGLDGHAVTACVANADISANSASPDQMPRV